MKVSDFTNPSTIIPLNTRATETESKISDITNLAPKAVFSSKAAEIQYKIFNTTSSITSPEFNRLM